MPRLALAILLVLCSPVMLAQQNYVFNRITRDDGFGLASDAVTSLYQDEKGFVWVGTNNGLQRFDGSKFIRYAGTRPGYEELPVSDIAQIIPMHGGKLMLLFGLLRQIGIFNPETFEYRTVRLKPAHSFPPGAVYSLWKDVQGNIELTVAGYGILRFEATANRFVPDQRFVFPKGYLPLTLGMFSDSVKNQVWFSCIGGICLYDGASKQMWWRDNNPQHVAVLNDTLANNYPHHIFIDSQRRLWVIIWKDRTLQLILCLDSLGRMLPSAVNGLRGADRYEDLGGWLETSDHGMWMYGEGAIYNYDKGSQKFNYYKSLSATTTNSNIVFERAFQMMEDRDGSIWVATDKGLYIASKQSGSYAINNYLGKMALNITGLSQTEKNKLWVTNWGIGLVLMDSAFNILPTDFYRVPVPKDFTGRQRDAAKLTWDVCQLPKSRQLLVACQDGVMMRYDSVSHKTDYMVVPAFQGWTVRTMARDSTGAVWLGSQGGHLVKYENGEFRLVQRVNAIIYRVMIDNEGMVWFNTNELGVFAVDPTSGKIIHHFSAGNHPNATFTNTGKDITQLNDSIIVAADGALHFINKRTGTVKIYGYESGLTSNNVYQVRRDDKGFLWIITSEGLCRYNPGNGRITAYGRRDGITQAGMTTEAGLTATDGTIIFGGNNALLSFRPDAFDIKELPPDVSITDFKIFNEFIPVDSLLQHPEIKLAPDQNSFSIYFAALSFLQRDRLTYYYKMEGIDKEWKSDARYQNYALLPPGKYTFRVYCENMEGVRSAHITSIAIVIKPPFYKTKWFISLVFLLIALLGYGIHSARLHRLLAVEKLRNKVARDLHDDMGSTLSTINILSSMAKTKIGTDTVKATEYLGKISDNSQRMMEAMDDIVWSIKPSNDSMQKITARMREFATNVLEAKDVNFRFSVSDEVYDVKLDMAARRDFFLIFKEAINNAAKYSGATEVNVDVAVRDKQICLSIADNGKGFDPKTADGGNGISNMAKRAESMRAAFSIDSAPGRGCRVDLCVLPG